MFGLGLGQFHFYFLKFLDFEELNIKKFPWISKKEQSSATYLHSEKNLQLERQFSKIRQIYYTDLKGEKCFRFSKLIKYSQSFPKS